MNNAVLAILIVGGIAGFVIFGFFLAAADAARWKKRLEEAFRPLGFRMNQTDKEAVAQRLLIVNERHSRKRLVLHLYHQESPARRDCALYACDYRFGSSSGRARGAQRLVLCLISNKLKLPRFTVEAVPQQTGLIGNILRKMGDAFPLPGLHKIGTGNPDFDRRFAFYAQEEHPLSAGTRDIVVNILLRSPGDINFDVKGDTLAFTSPDIDLCHTMRNEVNTEKFSELITLAKALFEELRMNDDPGLANP